MPSSHLILCHSLLLLSPIPPCIRVFSNESTLHMRWPKYWSFSFNIIPSKEIPELISFRMDWLDLLAVQGTLKSLLQHHRSKASILRGSFFFTVQLSHLYMTTGKTIALTRGVSNSDQCRGSSQTIRAESNFKSANQCKARPGLSQSEKTTRQDLATQCKVQDRSQKIRAMHRLRISQSEQYTS